MSDGHPAFDLTGKVAFVTGASRGLGREMAIALSRAGADVVLTGRDPRALAEAREATRAAGGGALAVTMEVTDRASVERAVQQAVEAFGAVDVLVNNAGVVSLQPFLELTEAEFHRLLDVNLLGAYRCCQVVGRLMVERKSGKIINISSIGALLGRSHEVGYAATKAALLALTRHLAVEWARHNVLVNAVCPGVFHTDISGDVYENEEIRQRIERRITLRRLGKPSELAPTILFLASSASDFMTGQTITVDGGETIK